jgi:hypothetical protein
MTRLPDDVVREIREMVTGSPVEPHLDAPPAGGSARGEYSRG